MIGDKMLVDNTQRNKEAKEVYGIIKKHKKQIENGPEFFIIKNFDNCRERGYTIEYGDKEVSFATNRNSDDIVVYPFKWENNDDIEEDYKTKSKYFLKTKEAYNFIMEYLGIDAKEE